MPDFGKALRGLTGAGLPAATRSWESQLAQYVLAGLSPRSVLPALPEGEDHSNRLGSHYFIHKTYTDDYFHGKVRLSRFCSADLECLMKLMREKGSVPHRDRIVFL